MYKNRFRGFTLIELLVVIAIIGILSAVVLASLTTVRSRSNDTAIQANLSTVRTQAAIFYEDNSSSYGTDSTDGACNQVDSVFTDQVITNAITSIMTANGCVSPVCRNSATAYAISSRLSTDNNRFWCVDSMGAASESSTALDSTVCPQSN